MLADEKCAAPRSSDKPLAMDEARQLAAQVSGWSLGEKTLEREFRFRDFREAMAFVNRVADLANAQDHHPDIFISYNRVRLTLSTHRVGGLTRNDFILADKIDRLLAGPPTGN